MIIRQMEASDIVTLIAWMLHVPLWQRYGFTAGRGTQQFNRALAEGAHLSVVDLPEAPVCGFTWVIHKGAFGRSPYLKMIGVHPAHTAAGIGSSLLNHVEKSVHPPAHELFLLASDFNSAAHRFYQRHGYRHIGTIPGYVLPDVDEFIFWKKLAS